MEPYKNRNKAEKENFVHILVGSANKFPYGKSTKPPSAESSFIFNLI